MALTQAERDELYLYVGGEVRKVQEQIAAYRSSLEAIAGDISKLTDASRAKPNAIDWPTLESEERDAKLAELDEWIDSRLSRYEAMPNSLNFRCWRRHAEVVDILTALWLTWVAAYRTPKAPATDAARWLTDWLPKLCAEVRSGLHQCRPQQCYFDSESYARIHARGY